MVFEKVLTAEEFDPEVIMNSGQVFRMKKEGDYYSACSETTIFIFILILKRIAGISFARKTSGAFGKATLILI